MVKYYVYVLKSQPWNRHYIGTTSNPAKRILTHNSGGNTSTRHGRPWKLIYLEEFQSKTDAWLREKQIKKYKNGEAFRKLINHGSSNGPP